MLMPVTSPCARRIPPLLYYFTSIRVLYCISKSVGNPGKAGVAGQKQFTRLLNTIRVQYVVASSPSKFERWQNYLLLNLEYPTEF